MTNMCPKTILYTPSKYENLTDENRAICELGFNLLYRELAEGEYNAIAYVNPQPNPEGDEVLVIYNTQNEVGEVYLLHTHIDARGYAIPSDEDTIRVYLSFKDAMSYAERKVKAHRNGVWE